MEPRLVMEVWDGGGGDTGIEGGTDKGVRAAMGSRLPGRPSMVLPKTRSPSPSSVFTVSQILPRECILIEGQTCLGRRVLLPGFLHDFYGIYLVYACSSNRGSCRRPCCRRIGKLDRRWGPLAEGRTERKKVSIAEVGIVHDIYLASCSTTVAAPYVLL